MHTVISQQRPLRVPPSPSLAGASAQGGALAMGMRQQRLAAQRAASLNRAGIRVNTEVCADVAARATPRPSLAPEEGRCEMPPPPSKQLAVRALAISVGCIDPPQATARLHDRWAEEPPATERHTLRRLREAAAWRVASALRHEEGPGQLQTGLRWFSRFRAALPSRVPFMEHRWAGDLQAAAYNEETFQLFAEFIRQHGSVRAGHTGEVVSAASISAYVSAVRAYRSRDVGYNLLIKEGNQRLPNLLRHMRREDGPAGQRELSRALTSKHLRALAERADFDKTSAAGVLRWAVLVVGHNLLLRGGELGTTDDAAFDSRYGLTLADVEWHSPGADTRGYEVASVNVVPIKDTHANRRRVPCLIQRVDLRPRSVPTPEGVKCPWEALRRLWLARMQQVSAHAASVTPMFAKTDGAAVRTTDVLAYIRQAATALSLPAGDFDARALRIGGATDLLDMFGPAEAERFIKSRGRWATDIGNIYARPSVDTEMAASAALSRADGTDMEAFRNGYVMPALRRR